MHEGDEQNGLGEHWQPGDELDSDDIDFLGLFGRFEYLENDQ